MAELLTSVHNPKIKKLLALQQKSSERRESGLFVVEGVRELQHCIDSGYEVDSVFVSALFDGAEALPAPDSLKDPSHNASPFNGSLSESGAGNTSASSRKAETNRESISYPASRQC